MDAETLTDEERRLRREVALEVLEELSERLFLAMKKRRENQQILIVEEAKE
jgi:hypothetical protein